MRIFREPNVEQGFICPICKTSDKSPVTLVGVSETEEDGRMNAIQVHVDCLQLVVVDLEQEGKNKVIIHAGEIK